METIAATAPTPEANETIAPETANPAPSRAETTRAETNRANAAHSTGPRTAEGKAASRNNSFKHGIYAKTAVLHTENPVEYEAAIVLLAQQYAPVTEKHLELIKKLVDAQWRLERIVATESSLYAVCIEEQRPTIVERFPEVNPEFHDSFAQACGYRAECRLFEQLHRQEHRLRRLIDRNRAELAFLAASSEETAAESENSAAGSQPEPAAEPQIAVDSGFVPAKSPIPPQPASQPRPNMPKFSGPNGKKDRKRWLRAHAQRNAA